MIYHDSRQGSSTRSNQCQKTQLATQSGQVMHLFRALQRCFIRLVNLLEALTEAHILLHKDVAQADGTFLF